MSLKSFVKKLVKKKIVSVKLHPGLVFLLSLACLTLFVFLYVYSEGFLVYFFLFLFIFSLIFAILHWIVVVLATT